MSKLMNALIFTILTIAAVYFEQGFFAGATFIPAAVNWYGIWRGRDIG